MNNYFQFNHFYGKHNFYPPYSNNPINLNKYQLSNSIEQKNQNKKEMHNIYDNNLYNVKNNSINAEQKVKNVSLQEEILSPNIEDNRPSIPVPIYNDDSRYKNFYNFNYNYNQNYYEKNLKFNQNSKNNNSKNFNNINNQNEKKGIFGIHQYKNINYNKKMLILDLDETLVHSCFKPAENINNNLPRPDIFLKIKFHSKYHDVFVYKRPFVEEFLEKMSECYNLIIFTASVQEYADPLLNQLDKNRYIKLRYYRNSCLLDKNGKFIKNLLTIYNDLKDVILLDNNPISYSYNKSNGLPIITWHFDKKDRELLKIIPILEFLSTVNDIRNYLPRFVEYDMVNFYKFNILIDEINKEREQNNYIKNRPKSSKHISTSNKGKIKERNKNQLYNEENMKYNTININNISPRNKDKENTNSNKSLVIKKIELGFNKEIKRENNKKNKIVNNLFKKNSKQEKLNENKREKINFNENRNKDYLMKDNKINNFIIVNDKKQNKTNDIPYNKQERNEINNSKNIAIMKEYRKNNPFIMNSATKGENKRSNFLSNFNNDIDERNKNIQINIINNIQQINLFKNDFDLKSHNVKKLDIINYYKNNSQKKQEKKNNSYILKEDGNKSKEEIIKINQSYSNKNELNKNNSKNKKKEINNSQNYNHQTAKNFYPKTKSFFPNKKINNENNNNLKKNNTTELSNNLNRDKSNFLYKNITNNKYNMFNNYIYNNNISQDKIQVNNQINKEKQNYIRNDYLKRMTSYDDINYRPMNFIHFENSNYNNFYNYNNNLRYINNIHPIHFENGNNNNSMNYRHYLDNNYRYNTKQKIFYH